MTATIKAFGGKTVTRAPKGGFAHPVNGRAYKGGQFCPLYSVSGGSEEAKPARGPETAVVGLRYDKKTYDGGRGCFVDLVRADWVTRETARDAGFGDGGPWSRARVEELGDMLSLADFDRIAGVTRGPGGRLGGDLDGGGVKQAMALMESRKAAREELDRAKAEARRAEVAALRAEVADPDKAGRRCQECGQTYGHRMDCCFA